QLVADLLLAAQSRARENAPELTARGHTEWVVRTRLDLDEIHDTAELVAEGASHGRAHGRHEEVHRTLLRADIRRPLEARLPGDEVAHQVRRREVCVGAGEIELRLRIEIAVNSGLDADVRPVGLLHVVLRGDVDL